MTTKYQSFTYQWPSLLNLNIKEERSTIKLHYCIFKNI